MKEHVDSMLGQLREVDAVPDHVQETFGIGLKRLPGGAYGMTGNDLLLTIERTVELTVELTAVFGVQWFPCAEPREGD